MNKFLISTNLSKSILIFFVNGKKIEECNPDPEWTLLTYLREKLFLCGTKLGCGEGGCGACTVMVSKINRETNEIKHLAVNACLTPVCSVHGCAVITVEGIGSTRTRLHPVQERIAKAHGSQCGFCTPGIVMSMYALLRSSPQPSMKDLEVAFQGNLCRCTGYRPIIEGYKSFTKEFTCGMGDKCCKLNKNDKLNMEDELFNKGEFTPYNESQEPIFPPELKISDALDHEFLVFTGPKVTWYRPNNLCDLLAIKSIYPNAKIVVGNTEIGVEVKFKHCIYPVLINTSQIKELNEMEIYDDGIFIGASVSLMDLEKKLKSLIKKCPEEETRLYECITNMLHYFAGKQIRNVASLGGNIMTGSPISDMNPILTAAGIEMKVAGYESGNKLFRKVNMGKGFFTGYRKNVINSHEVLIGLRLPKTTSNQYMIAYKQAKRRDDDIAIVNAAINIVFKKGTNIIENINMAFGGMAPTTVLAPKTAGLLIGSEWNEKMLEKALRSLGEELPLSTSAPGGMISYRRSLVTSLFYKTYLSICKKIQQLVPEKEQSGANVFHNQIPNSAQLFEKTSNSRENDTVGTPKVHSSAYKQATGEAIYTDDIPKTENELYLALVLSSKSNAKILCIDPSEALKVLGVHAFFSSEHIQKEVNYIGFIPGEEEIFSSTKVQCQGQTIGAVVAESKVIAKKAARMVKISYEEEFPIIISIEDAIKHKSFFPGYPKTFLYGNIDESMPTADVIVEGSCRMGGQEHFYLETNSALALPRDNDEIEIFCSTQMPKETQKTIAQVLNLPSTKINVRVKRIGGAFGGKEIRSMLVSVPVALAAHKLKKPVRCMLDRDEDMQITGTRHPFYFKYKVGCTKNGKIIACDIQMFSNGGCTSDLSFGVMDRAILTFTNSYVLPNLKITATVCKTNLPSNTALRGFGSPQAMFACENMIRNIARVCKKDYLEIALINMFKEGDITHYNQKIENCTIRRCWNDCIEQSNFHEKRKQCSEFNKNNFWKKRAVAICPTTYGIAFSILQANQAGALVNIYEDGSVLLAIGGVEMGQGLYSKMIQIASKLLGISTDKIHITETSTEKIPNATSSAASLGSDLYGMAILNACEKLNNRLNPIKKNHPNDSWEFWIKKAYLDRISLSANGFYKTPEIGYDPIQNKGKAFLYYTQGAAASVVEIDCLTGDHQILRTDIVMDIGSSLNPAIDIGQIEGAFMQGYGLYTMEEMLYSSEGAVLTKGPSTYKIPSFSNIPIEFNVSLLTDAPNPKAIFSSKAVGEPPLFLAASIFFAIEAAVLEARKERNLDDSFNIISPATSERIRMACEDKFTNMVEIPLWNVMA